MKCQTLTIVIPEEVCRNKYAIFNEKDALWYWNQYVPSFWIGPADVRIPSSIKCVPSTDENNEMESDGSVTEANQGHVMSDEKYRNMYAVFNENDGEWYWNQY